MLDGEPALPLGEQAPNLGEEDRRGRLGPAQLLDSFQALDDAARLVHDEDTSPQSRPLPSRDVPTFAPVEESENGEAGERGPQGDPGALEGRQEDAEADGEQEDAATLVTPFGGGWWGIPFHAVATAAAPGRGLSPSSESSSARTSS